MRLPQNRGLFHAFSYISPLLGEKVRVRGNALPTHSMGQQNKNDNRPQKGGDGGLDPMQGYG